MSLYPHLHHNYLCPSPSPPLPLLTLFELWGSLVSGLLLDGSAGAEWSGGGVGAASVVVGGAGGGEAVVILEGPGESEKVRCAPVNRHIGREEEGSSCD